MNVRSNFEHFETNMTLIANVFRKLQTAKDVAKQMSKKSLFRTPFKKRHGKRFQTLLKSSPLLYSFITTKAIELERNSLSDI